MSASTVQITSRGSQAKLRNPWVVCLLSVVTLGIYHLFWYYFVNREMADYGEAHQTDIGMSPAISVLAITIGGFIIIPPFVSVFRSGKRMQLAQRVAAVNGGSAALYLLMTLIPLVNIFASAYLQAELNKVWQAELNKLRAEPVVAEPVAA